MESGWFLVGNIVGLVTGVVGLGLWRGMKWAGPFALFWICAYPIVVPWLCSA